MASENPSPERGVIRCEQCGVALGPASVSGLCHKCLYQAALTPDSEDGVEVGGEFGKYTLGRQLGRGGMGVVYEAFNHTLRRHVAIKMILDAFTFSPAAKQRFQFEAQAVARLAHPNIVPIYDAGEHMGQPYIAMKLISGESLRAKIKSGDLSLPPASLLSRRSARDRCEVIARLIATVAEAVQHAHDRHILHRDLKPANIIVDEDGEPHLTDFGLAKWLANEGETAGKTTHEDGMLGTLAYMSPEQVTNQRLTIASDIYSLGAILYEMLTGRVPFRGNSPADTVRVMLDQEPVRPRALNPLVAKDLETICLRCLEKRAVSRYSTAAAVAQELKRWLRNQPVVARPLGLHVRSQRWVRRNPVGAALIVALSCCLILAVMLLRTSREREQEQSDAKDLAFESLKRQTHELWTNASTAFVEISSAQIATLLGKPVQKVGPGTLQLRFAVTIRDSPISQADNFAPFLRHLEDEMRDRLKRPVLINLRLYHIRGWGNSAIVNGQADVQVLSALTAWRLQSEGHPIHLAFRGKGRSSAVIFARTGESMRTLADVNGKRVAFAHTNSVLSCYAKLVFATNGICAANLSDAANFDRELSRLLGIGGDMLEFDSSYAHQMVLEKVLDGEFDVGVAPRERFDENSHRGLVEIHSFDAMPAWFVLSGSVEPGVAKAFTDTVLNMRDGSRKAMLGPWGKASVGGVQQITKQDVAEMGRAVAAQESCFSGLRQYSPRTAARHQTNAFAQVVRIMQRL